MPRIERYALTAEPLAVSVARLAGTHVQAVEQLSEDAAAARAECESCRKELSAAVSRADAAVKEAEKAKKEKSAAQRETALSKEATTAARVEVRGWSRCRPTAASLWRMLQMCRGFGPRCVLVLQLETELRSATAGRSSAQAEAQRLRGQLEELTKKLVTDKASYLALLCASVVHLWYVLVRALVASRNRLWILLTSCGKRAQQRRRNTRRSLSSASLPPAASLSRCLLSVCTWG